MKKKILIFSLFNIYVDSFNMAETKVRPISFIMQLLNRFEVYYLDFNLPKNLEPLHSSFPEKKKVPFSKIIKTIFPDIEILNIELGNYLDMVFKQQSFDIEYRIDLDMEFDIILTYNNWIDIVFGNLNDYSNIEFRHLKFLTKNNEYFIYFSHYYSIYRLFNNFFYEQKNSNKLQLLSDPLEFKYKGFMVLTSDISNTELLKSCNQGFFPFQQYYYMLSSKPLIKKKVYEFICGNTIFDDYRYKLFEKYLKDFYECKKDKCEYRIYGSTTNFVERYNFA